MLTEMEEERQKIEVSNKGDNVTIIAVNSRKLFSRESPYCPLLKTLVLKKLKFLK